jgi:Fic-DOC domain mobile mystery protein B
MGRAFRDTPRNIGVEAWEIAPQLRLLLDDARYWVEHQTYGADEIAVRFHHRLVWIHPFANGNGRLSRLAADLLIVALGQERFTWGSGNLVAIADLRKRYLDALRAADGAVIEPLIEFARS